MLGDSSGQVGNYPPQMGQQNPGNPNAMMSNSMAAKQHMMQSQMQQQQQQQQQQKMMASQGMQGQIQGKNNQF